MELEREDSALQLAYSRPGLLVLSCRSNPKETGLSALNADMAALDFLIVLFYRLLQPLITASTKESSAPFLNSLLNPTLT